LGDVKHFMFLLQTALLVSAFPWQPLSSFAAAVPLQTRTPTQQQFDCKGQDPEALTARARAHLKRGDETEAQRLLACALAIRPDAFSANLTFGKLLLSQQSYPEAMDRFETALATHVRDPEARAGELTAATQLALHARQSGNQDAALKCLQHARLHLADDPTLLTDLGIQAHLLHQLPEASEALNAALRLRPNSSTALYALARVETDWQRFPAAESHLRAYLVTHPDDASAHFGLGHLLFMQQHLEDARTEFNRSIELQPLQTESYYQIGQMDLDAHADADAAVLFEKALGRNPRHGGALTGMGILAYRAKQYTSARGRLTAAVESSPGYQPAHYYLGLTLARLGEKAASDHELALATQLTETQHAAPHSPAPLAPE